MKERLIIISDLWGEGNAEWLIHYTDLLARTFALTFYDSCELGAIDTFNYTQDSLHQQFIHGGITSAVEQLAEREPNPVPILAFSVGGVIAWKFGLKTDNMTALFSVSSTRLRKETLRPNGHIALYFGEQDPYQPTAPWVEQMQLEYQVLPNKGHQVYRETAFAKRLSQHIVQTLPLTKPYPTTT